MGVWAVVGKCRKKKKRKNTGFTYRMNRFFASVKSDDQDLPSVYSRSHKTLSGNICLSCWQTDRVNAPFGSFQPWRCLSMSPCLRVCRPPLLLFWKNVELELRATAALSSSSVAQNNCPTYHVTKCLCRYNGLKSETMELPMCGEMAFSFNLSDFQPLLSSISKVAAKPLYFRIQL